MTSIKNENWNTMHQFFQFLMSVGIVVGCLSAAPDPIPDIPSNQVNEQRMLLVLNAPSVNDPYYAKAHQQIIDFQIAYALKIMGKDNVVVLTDSATRPFFTDKLPEDVLLTRTLGDIWMRDFTTVNPESPVQFTYTWASMPKRQSREVQGSFEAFSDQLGVQRDRCPYLLDGGNLVDNYTGSIVTTTRFLEDNGLRKAEGIQELKRWLNASEVAILEPDDAVLAHADGMVAWVDEEVLLVNDYASDAAFRKLVMKELQSALPNAQLVPVSVAFDASPNLKWPGFESACGINLNLVMTHHYLYVPVFGKPHEQKALQTIRENTSKTVVEVDARNVCGMGGSVRCLTWQVVGKNAKKIIQAARTEAGGYELQQTTD